MNVGDYLLENCKANSRAMSHYQIEQAQEDQTCSLMPRTWYLHIFNVRSMITRIVSFTFRQKIKHVICKSIFVLNMYWSFQKLRPLLLVSSRALIPPTGVLLQVLVHFRVIPKCLVLMQFYSFLTKPKMYLMFSSFRNGLMNRL